MTNTMKLGQSFFEQVINSSKHYKSALNSNKVTNGIFERVRKSDILDDSMRTLNNRGDFESMRNRFFSDLFESQSVLEMHSNVELNKMINDKRMKF